MLCDFNDIQEAFVDGRITIEQLIEVLVDNFGVKATKNILKNNIKLAMKSERKK